MKPNARMGYAALTHPTFNCAQLLINLATVVTPFALTLNPSPILGYPLGTSA
ncbi:MAG: hypothetical protein ACRDEA_03640 [Microcystaceae cyanobacterium]